MSQASAPLERKRRLLRQVPDDIQRMSSAADAAGLTGVLRFAGSREAVWSAHFALVSLGELAVGPLVAFLRDDLTCRSQRAWWTLIRIGAPVHGLLAECLHEQSVPPPARAAAAWILGHVAERAVDRDLVKALSDPDDDVKLAAALMLGFRGCREAVPGLLGIVTRGSYRDSRAPHPDQMSLRLAGVEAFGRVIDEDEVEGGPCCPLRKGQGGETARDMAACLPTFGERGLADDVEVLLEIAGPEFVTVDFRPWREPDVVAPSWVTAPWCHWDCAQLREAAVLSLGRIGDSRAVESLICCADDERESPDVRRFAVEALGCIGDATGFDPVFAALSNDALVYEALSALGGFCDRRALEPLVRAAMSDQVTRFDAISSLSTLADGSTLPHLNTLTRDTDPYIVRQALRGLARLGSQAALEAIVPRLVHGDPAIRRQAAAALRWAQLGDKELEGAEDESLWHP